VAFTLDGTIVRWPGSTGVVRQEGLRQDVSVGGRNATIVELRIERKGEADLRGSLRFTSDTFQRLPGKDDGEKAAAVARRLVGWVHAHGLIDGFFFRVDADDDGVQILEAADL
jgi:hypothetical protein